MPLKEERIKFGITQEEAAELFSLSRKTYISYENDSNKKESIKYKYMFDYFVDKNKIDEEHGILKIHEIKDIVSIILMKYDVDSCYLFGSYAKGKAKETSDVDLVIDSNVEGIRFYSLVEELRTSLHKEVDLISLEQLMINKELLKDILKDGIKIYGKGKGQEILLREN